MNYLKSPFSFKIHSSKIGVLLLAAGLGFYLASCHTGNKKSTQNVVTGDSASSHIDTITSKINYYSGLIASNPNNADAYWNRGKLQMLNKSNVLAAADFMKAVRLDSTKSDYFFSLATANFATGHTHEAKDAFEASIRLNPKNTEAILKLAELFYFVKMYPEALEQVDNAIKINPYLAREYFLKGMIFTDKHDTARAISSMQTAVDQDPNYFLAYIQLGIIFASKNNPIALTYFDDAIRVQPQNAEPYYDKGMFYQFHGDYDNAIASYLQISKLDSLSARPDTLYKHAYYNLGDIYFENKDDVNKSLEYFNRAVKSDTGYYMGYFGRANCYEKLHQIDKALADYAHTYRINPRFKPAAESYRRLKNKN